MNYLEIESVVGREILDSRGNPTVEAEITLADGTVPRSRRFAGNAAVPFSGRRKRQPPARAHDEHPERRRTRHQHRGHAGVHDHAGGCTLL